MANKGDTFKLFGQPLEMFHSIEIEMNTMNQEISQSAFWKMKKKTNKAKKVRNYCIRIAKMFHFYLETQSER